MKTDLYTKAILTLIAIALVVIVFQNLEVVPTATARIPINSNEIDVNIVSINGQSIFGGELEVKVVNIPKVEIKSSYGGLDVKVTNPRDFK